MASGMKLGAGAVAAIAAALIGYRVYLAFLDDETRIRRMVVRMEEAFNEGRAGAITENLAPDFSEEGSRLGRDELRAFLIRFFLTEKDRRTGQLRYRMEVEPADVKVELEGEGAAEGTLEVTARFFLRGARGAEQPASSPEESTGGSTGGSPMGSFLFTGHLKKVDGEWRIGRARSRLMEGRSPF